MLNSGTRPPSGVKLSCIAFTAPQLASVVTVANNADWTIPNRTSLPSMLPPGCVSVAADSTPRRAMTGLPACSRRTRRTRQRGRSRSWRRRAPSLAAVSFTILPNGTGQAGRDEEDEARIWRKLAERRRVFERVGRVGVEEAAAVGAEHLDGFLRRHRPLRDRLRRAFERGGVGVRRPVLDDALRTRQSATSNDSGSRM